MKVAFGNQPFPKQQRCTLRYVALKTVTAAAASTGYVVFSTNGLYDPDISGTGTQPLYFDQLTNLYDHYTVLNSRIRVSFAPGNTNQEAQICGVHIDDDNNVGVVDGGLFAQRPGAIARMMNPEANAPVIMKKWSARDTHSGNPLSKAELAGNVSANPTEQSYYVIWAHNTSIASAQNVDFFIQVEYDVMWHELKTVTAS